MTQADWKRAPRDGVRCLVRTQDRTLCGSRIPLVGFAQKHLIRAQLAVEFVQV